MQDQNERDDEFCQNFSIYFNASLGIIHLLSKLSEKLLCLSNISHFGKVLGILTRMVLLRFFH